MKHVLLRPAIPLNVLPPHPLLVAEHFALPKDTDSILDTLPKVHSSTYSVSWFQLRK